MKIEICESLILSWLRHAQGCVVAQTAWKPSPTWAVARERELAETFDTVRNFAGREIGVQVFKNGSFSQFIRQAEIDVLGLRLLQGTGARTAIAVDTAFHEGGTNYGGADETVGRVLKKLIRSAFALEAFLDPGEATVVLATPKMAERIEHRIKQQLVELETLLARQSALAIHRLRFRVVANRAFTEEILVPVQEHAGSVADTSELFMRAQQLVNLCGGSTRSRSCKPHQRCTAEDDIKIGEHVRQTMRELAASDQLNSTVVGRLLDSHYCKANFNLGLPFLKRVNPDIDLSRQRIDANGYGRYWKRPIKIGGHDFLMCCQWFVWQRNAFDRWVHELGQKAC